MLDNAPKQKLETHSSQDTEVSLFQSELQHNIHSYWPHFSPWMRNTPRRLSWSMQSQKVLHLMDKSKSHSMTETESGPAWNSHVLFNLFQVLLISKYSFDTRSEKAMVVGWWHLAAWLDVTPSLRRESLAPRHVLRHCTHTKGDRKCCSTLMREGVLWSYIRPEKREERGSLFSAASFSCAWRLLSYGHFLLTDMSFCNLFHLFSKRQIAFFNISYFFL